MAGFPATENTKQEVIRQVKQILEDLEAGKTVLVHYGFSYGFHETDVRFRVSPSVKDKDKGNGR